MTNDEIASYCLLKPGAYIDYPFGPDVVIFKVKNRIFAQLFTLKDEPVATFNCDADVGEFYRRVYPDTVTRGYHCPAVQQPYFNTVKLDGTVPDGEIRPMIDHSYDRVLKKLPRKSRMELEDLKTGVEHEA